MSNSKNYAWTIDGKIQIIRDFAPMPMPTFDGAENAMRYNVWLLYSRVCESIKSFLVLVENVRYYDAFLIAGHALETCSVLSYIKDNESEQKQRDNYNKYFARSAVGRLLAILDMDKTNLAMESAQNAYIALLKILYPVGASIIKKDKNYEDIIKSINIRGGTNAEKLKLLRDSFTRPDPDGYVASFSNRIGNFDDGQFAMYYTKYCNYKHSNMLTSGADSADIDNDEIDWFLNLVLGIIMYLDKSKLAPYVK
jgi:hypothetical protein